MRIRCRECNKVFNDGVIDERLMEGTCKRCVAGGKEAKPIVGIFSLKQMLANDPEFAKAWKEEGLEQFVFWFSAD